MKDTFELYNLDVTVIGDKTTFACDHTPGLAFQVNGEDLIFVKRFSMYTLASLIPLLPAKQRNTHANDWMTSDDIISCPDPNCGARFKISRTGRTTYRHGEVTRNPLNDADKASS